MSFEVFFAFNLIYFQQSHIYIYRDTNYFVKTSSRNLQSIFAIQYGPFKFVCTLPTKVNFSLRSKCEIWKHQARHCLRNMFFEYVSFLNLYVELLHGHVYGRVF